MSGPQDIAELYQQVILDHNKNPRNYRKMSDSTHEQEGYNPLCGDHLFVYAKVNEQGLIEDISFHGEGCAISKASASMMTAFLKGKPEAEAKELFEQFHRLLTHDLDPEKEENTLGKLQVFSGIWKYPARVKCASLGWHTMKAALEKAAAPVKTE